MFTQSYFYKFFSFVHANFYPMSLMSTYHGTNQDHCEAYSRTRFAWKEGPICRDGKLSISTQVAKNKKARKTPIQDLLHKY